MFRKWKTCDLKNIPHNYLFLKIRISCTVSRQPEAMSAHKLHKVFLQQDVQTSSSYVRTWLAVSLCFLTCPNSLADASSRKSMFCIMSRHKRQDSEHRKVFHADVQTLGQHVRTCFKESLIADKLCSCLLTSHIYFWIFCLAIWEFSQF